ncbi:alpha/beta hydrolase [Lampropedia aestuarii]|uniref:Alpha/beta hydrolase n=2 Tax=Lampropedia aestuarii TaxID=2562762 RepID=A0A4S5BEI3_9BURK|nr:alpha/beta hydrolase [Lampropedia aestuarii]
MIDAINVEFPVDGDFIRGTLYLPESTKKIPAVALAHGWAMVAGGDLEDYALQVATRGIAALSFDYRNLGKSDGKPRQHLDPHRQVEDFKAAISFLRTQKTINPDQIGIWGSSYGGGHVLTVAATDPRVRCVVSQVPTISSWRAATSKLNSEELTDQCQRFIRERESSFAGAPLSLQKTIGINPSEVVTYPDKDSYDYMSSQGARCPEWKDYTTLSSLELARNYEPGAYIYRIKNTPTLMIIASRDTTTPHELQRDAFAAMTCPKELIEIEGGHYVVYQEALDKTSNLAADWFKKHLCK